jgi:hypothetical protein
MMHAKPPAARRLVVLCLAIGVLAVSLGAVETLSQRRRRVEAMSPEQREELFRREKDFRALPPEERQRIQDLHDQIEKAEDRDKLLAVMSRYCKWLDTLQPPLRREKLHDKKNSLGDRLAMVERYLKEQKLNPSKDIRLDDKSRRALAAWMDRYTADHAARFIEALAQGARPGVVRPDVAKMSPPRQQAVVREMILRGWQRAGPNAPSPLTETEAERLRAALTPGLWSKLEVKKPAEQLRIIAEWLRETPSRELDEQLADYFENSIDEEQRDQLMSLPGDMMYRSLTEQYLAHVRSTDPQQRRNDPSRHNDRQPWQRGGGRHPGPPRGSGDRRVPRDVSEGEAGQVESGNKK